LIKEEKLEVDYVTKNINGVVCNTDHQAFINNEFVDGSTEQVYDTINPADESVICQVARATVDDVNDAVAAA
jgi:formyltetrahydrofolate dehydrogenase